MELTKVNEGYTFVDTSVENWKANGNITKEISGNISMNCDITSVLGDYIGYMNYYKPQEGNINLNYSVSEDNREEFGNYVDNLIDAILKEIV